MANYKADLIEKIDEIFGFNLSNSIDSVDYNFGQYKLNQLYKPLVQYFVNEFSKFLDSNDSNDSNQIITLFVDFFKLYYYQGDFGYFKSKYSSFTYKIPYGMDYTGTDAELRRASKDCYYVKTSDVVNNMDIQVPTADLTVKNVRLQFFKKTKTNSDGKTLPLDLEIEEINNENKEVSGYNIYIYNYDEDKANKSSKEKFILDKIQNYGIQVTPGVRNALSDFLAKRGRDYFIHKNLKEFLRGELERYLFQVLKGDIQGRIDVLSVENKIEEIKRKYEGDNEYIEYQIAKIYAENTKETKTTVFQSAFAWIYNFINILGDLEEFKARLRTKKRKPIEQEFCISLGKIKELETLIPRKEEILKYIFENDKQIQEWKDLGMSKNPTVDDDLLVVDTKNFQGEQREKIVNLITEDKITGKLYNSDNYQALSYMEQSNNGKIDCIYIDPPYNTGTDGFVYKDGYNESSWLTMINARIRAALNCLSDSGVMFISIDDNEITNLKKICDDIFGEQNTDIMIWRKSGVGRDGKMKNTTTFRKDHEYIIVCFKNKVALNKLTEKPNFVNDYSNPDNDPRGNWMSGSLSRSIEGSNPNHENYYSVTSPNGTVYTRQFEVSKDDFDKLDKDNRISWGKDGGSVPRLKIFINEERSVTPYSILLEKGTTTEGTKELNGILNGDFSEIRPKPSFLIQTLVQLGSNSNSIVLDFFAGSGTTGQSVLAQNKKDSGNRKFLEVELGGYFDSITLKRTKKIMYSQEWSEGNPMSDGTLSIVEYVRLNQYEDRFSTNGYLTKFEGEISGLRDLTIEEDTRISQILSPLNELKDRIYGIDDQLSNSELQAMSDRIH